MLSRLSNRSSELINFGGRKPEGFRQSIRFPYILFLTADPRSGWSSIYIANVAPDDLMVIRDRN
jgi:hypothetical protein